MNLLSASFYVNKTQDESRAECAMCKIEHSMLILQPIQSHGCQLSDRLDQPNHSPPSTTIPILMKSYTEFQQPYPQQFLLYKWHQGLQGGTGCLDCSTARWPEWGQSRIVGWWSQTPRHQQMILAVGQAHAGSYPTQKRGTKSPFNKFSHWLKEPVTPTMRTHLKELFSHPNW